MYKEYWAEAELENNIESSIIGLYPEFDSLSSPSREENYNKSIENDSLDKIIKDLYVKHICSPIVQKTNRIVNNIDCRAESTLSDIIENRIKQKPLPLALRKRLLYEQAIAKSNVNIKKAN